MPITKEQAARVLADAHFDIEDGLERVFIEIAEISPEEFSRLERGELALPPGWTLEGADDVPRPRAA